MTPLRQRFIEDMRIRNLTAATQKSYVEQAARFARHFNCSPDRLGPEQIRAYQVHLTVEKKLAPSSVIVAVSALRFLYNVTLRRRWAFDLESPTPQIPKKLPVVLSPEEVARFLASVEHVRHRTILTVCYAAGLRISEAVHLQVTDVDRERKVLRVGEGKGQKTATSCCRRGFWRSSGSTGSLNGPGLGCS
jgi:site-specific recombinase XerD